MNYEASCHCGNITGLFESSIVPARMELRKCVCSFCIKHGAISASDANGKVKLQVRNPKDLSEYRFGLRTVDFIVCSCCGVYMAALLKTENSVFATLNINTFQNSEEFTSPPKRVNYENDTASERVSRRQANWTPAELAVGN